MTEKKSLSIIIPAYNEEGAIRGTAEHCLAAIPAIRETACLDSVEVIVVSDGSTDSTAEIAGSIPDVRLIAYEKNRGYGAAIKTGFESSKGEYVAFLDGDGTCDPAFFGQLIHEMKINNADIGLGTRLHRNSRMPYIRRIGNLIFAKILSVLSGKGIQDSASGMRVLTRECLPWIPLLPDGLHFTPAMSALAAFDTGLRLIELPMPYSERQGRSKLSIIGDGFRFLLVILRTAYLYIPFRFFAVPGILMVVASIALVIPNIEDYFLTHHVEEGAFYKLYASALLFLIGINSFIFGLFAHNFSCLIRNRDFRKTNPATRMLTDVLRRLSVPLGVVLIAAGIFLNREAFTSYFMHGKIFIHWSRVVFGGLLVITGTTSLFYYMLYHLLDIFYKQKQSLNNFSREGRQEDAGA